MKICYVHQNLRRGGAEFVRLTLLEHLDLSRYQVRVCCLEEEGALGEELRALGVPLDVLGTSVRSLDVRTTWRLARYLRSHRPDVVQSSLTPVNIHARLAATLAGVSNIVCEEHSVGERYNPFLAPLLRRTLGRVAHRRAVTLVPSRAAQRAVMTEDGLTEERFFILPNPVNLRRLKPSISPEEARSRLGIEEDAWVVGIVGTLSWLKGHRYLLEAVPALLEDIPTLRVLVVGAGPLRSALEARSRSLEVSGRVSFVGEQHQVADFYQVMDCVAAPSLMESFGLTLVEALALAKPVVAHAIGGIPEVIEDGRTGLLVRPAQPRELVSAILRLRREPELAKKLGEAGRLSVMSRFAPEAYVRGMERLYRWLEGGSGSLPLPSVPSDRLQDDASGGASERQEAALGR